MDWQTGVVNFPLLKTVTGECVPITEASLPNFSLVKSFQLCWRSEFNRWVKFNSGETMWVPSWSKNTGPTLKLSIADHGSYTCFVDLEKRFKLVPQGILRGRSANMGLGFCCYRPYTSEVRAWFTLLAVRPRGRPKDNMERLCLLAGLGMPCKSLVRWLKKEKSGPLYVSC